MGIDILMLALSLLLILFACEIFVNAVEWFGKRLNLHQGIVGSILAAIGTALPETIVPIIAILFSTGPRAHHVGIGAIAGAPFMLGTLAFFLNGCAVLVFSRMKKRAVEMNANTGAFRKDLEFFFVIYGTAIATTFVRSIAPLRIAVAVALVSSYGIYLKKTIQSDVDMIDEPHELYFARFIRLPNNLTWIIAQLALGLALIIAGAHFFVEYVQTTSAAMGVSPLILSILITPIATELPEKFNSIIWIRKNKDTLAMGNISGAMVFQSCFPVAFGIIATDWNLAAEHGIPLVSAACTLASCAVIYFWLRTRRRMNPYVLMTGGLFYLVAIAYIARYV